jgi:hypothetical protein
MFMQHSRIITVCKAYFPSTESPQATDNVLKLFQFLKGLHNLWQLSIQMYPVTLRFSHLSSLMDAIWNAPLQQIFLNLEANSVASGDVISGPRDLEMLCIEWTVKDNAEEPGSSLTHLYEFICPSLRSLVWLKLSFYINPTSTKPDFDARFLNSASQLRTFRYGTHSQDAQILSTVANAIPNLDRLCLFLGPQRKRVEWKVFFPLHAHLGKVMTVDSGRLSGRFSVS